MKIDKVKISYGNDGIIPLCIKLPKYELIIKIKIVLNCFLIICI